MFEQNSTEYSPWNPFSPTKRDIDRTEELAKKNPTITGLFAFFFPIANLVYLNRGVNHLKIGGYATLACLIIICSYGSKSKKQELQGMIFLLNIITSTTIIVENVRCVTLARKRLATQNKIEE